MRYFAVAVLIAGLASGVGNAAILVDTGLTPRVSIHAAYDEYFTCDEDGGCVQDYELITNQASRFHVVTGGVAASLTVAAAHQFGDDTYSIYRAAGDRLVPDASHLVWYSGLDPVPTSSVPLTGAGFDVDGPASRDTYALGNLTLDAGDYWIAISVTGPTFGDMQPDLFAGMASGTNAEQKYFDNEPGPYPYVNFAGLQASVLIDGTLNTVGGVPEPATWSLLIAGFGVVGVVARRRQPAGATT